VILPDVYYPEEWDWTLDKQILKNLDSQYKAIDKINQSLKDFITLHHPCGRYLVTSIRNLLQVRPLVSCCFSY
jgi:hypothetical protein